MNGKRAEWAASCIRHFQCHTGTDWEDAVSDLLCDLRHFCDREGFDFSYESARAQMHYGAETQGEFTELLEALELCEEALSELARSDDGTPSISALHAARAAIAKAKGGAQ